MEVRAPLRMPKSSIEKFIASKEKWIEDKLLKSKTQTERRKSFSLDYGSLLTYRGRQYPIEAKGGSRAGFDGEHFYMPPNLQPEQIKAACVKVYRSLAKQYLTERTLTLSRLMSVVPADIKITAARTRWGSCSAKKNINYSWRLVMADDAVIDYVILHELAHTKEMNHSKKFWAIVESVLSNYREQKIKLKELQQKLGGEDW